MAATTPIKSFHSQPFRFIAAPFTPKAADGSVRYQDVPGMADFLLKRGVRGVFVNGTTGEGLSLTMEERRRLTEVWREASRGKLELVVHIGHTCVESARELAGHAESLHADAIAAIGPCFFGVNDSAVLSEYCGQIASGAPGTPFYYYHIPSMTRVGCKASQALAIMAKAIPTFAGIKFTHDDLADFRACLELGMDRFEIFFGRDELFLEALQAGGRSVVGSTYNFATPLYQKIADAFAAGDLAQARSLQDLATTAIEVMVRAGGMAGVHAAMNLAGFNAGALRLPLRALNENERGDLRVALEKLNYFQTIQA